MSNGYGHRSYGPGPGDFPTNIGGPPGGTYLGLGPLGYSLGYEMFGRKRDEAEKQKQLQQLQDLLAQMRPSTTQQATTTQQPTGRYQVGPEMGETTFPGAPPSLSNALTSQLPWGTEPEGSYGPGIPPYLPEPQEFGPSLPAGPDFPIPQRPPAITGPWNLGASTYPGLAETRVQPPPEGYGISPWMAQATPEVEAPPERPAAPPPGPAPVTGPRREPIPHVPYLGKETAPVTRMETVTKPGRELLDIIAQNPQMLEVLKAFPGLLPLIQQEQENQAWQSALKEPTPSVGASPVGIVPPVEEGTAAAAPTGAAGAPRMTRPAGAPTEGATDPVIANAKTALEPQIRAIARNPALLRGERGKAAMKNYLDLEKAQGEAEERLGKKQKLELEISDAAETAQFKAWALKQAEARYLADDPEGAERYRLLAQKPELGVQLMKEGRERNEVDARARFFNGLADKETDPDRKALLRAAGISQGVGEQAMKILKPEEKELSDSVLGIIADTGMDPRSGKMVPATPDLVKQAKERVAGRQERFESGQRAGAVARAQAVQDVKLNEQIGVDSDRFANPEDGTAPPPDMTRGDVYKNYVQVNTQQRAALQGGRQLEAVFSPEVVKKVESLFPSPIAKVNQGFQYAIREGLLSVPLWMKINLPGMPKYSKEQIIELQDQLALYDRMDAVATMVARNYGESGTVATKDTDRVTKGWSGAATYAQFKSAIGYMRDIHQRGKDYMLARNRVRVPQITVIPGAGTFEEVP